MNVTGAIRESSEDWMVRHLAFSLVISAFDPRGQGESPENEQPHSASVACGSVKGKRQNLARLDDNAPRTSSPRLSG